MVHENCEVYLVPTTCTVGDFLHFFQRNQLEYSASVNFVLLESVLLTERLTVSAQRKLLEKWFVYSAFSLLLYMAYFSTFCDLEGNTLAVHRVVTTIEYTNSDCKLLFVGFDFDCLVLSDQFEGSPDHG